MELPWHFAFIAQLPIPVVEPSSVGGATVFAILILIVVLLNAVLNGLKLYLDYRKKQNDTAHCNVPSEMVAAMRNAINRQQDIAEATKERDDRQERGIEKLIVALDRHTDRLNELLVESRALRRSRGD